MTRVGQLTGITSIDKEDLQPAEEQKKRFKQFGSVAILNAGGMKHHPEHQSKSID